jgi:hypothetical protein
MRAMRLSAHNLQHSRSVGQVHTRSHPFFYILLCGVHRTSSVSFCLMQGIVGACNGTTGDARDIETALGCLAVHTSRSCLYMNWGMNHPSCLSHRLPRCMAGVHVFEAAEIQIRMQILDPCLLLDSGLRDYEIKLDRGFSSATGTNY